MKNKEIKDSENLNEIHPTNSPYIASKAKEKWFAEYCPLSSSLYREYLEILQNINPSFVFFNAEPNGFPSKSEDIIYSFIGIAPVYVTRTRINQTMVQDLFTVPFVANLIKEPNCPEVSRYPNPTPSDHLKIWKGNNIINKNSYFELTQYCLKFNISLLENDDIMLLAEDISRVGETYLKKR